MFDCDTVGLGDISRNGEGRLAFVPRLVGELDIESMAEIGVYEGELAVVVLEQHPDLTYYAIDPWQPYPESHRTSPTRRGGWEAWGRRFETARRAIEEAGNRNVEIIRMTSVEAARTFQPGTLNLVFIDANHAFDHVDQDIRAWWPVVCPGGYLTGHDFHANFPGVREAVEANFPAYQRWGDVWAVRKGDES